MKQINQIANSNYRVVHKKQGKKSRIRSFRKRFGEPKPLPKATFKSYVYVTAVIGAMAYISYLITHTIFS